MALRYTRSSTETQKKRSYVRRMAILHGFLLMCLLIVVARLIDLQIIRSAEFAEAAAARHKSKGEIELQARRGEILALNSKSEETSILATNTTLDLVYVDPLSVDDPQKIAETLADVLVTQQIHDVCSKGGDDCPRELQVYYANAFDPLALVRKVRAQSGTFLEPLSSYAIDPEHNPLPIPLLSQVRAEFAIDIKNRIGEKRVTFVPLKYGATKPELNQVGGLNITGIHVDVRQNLIYADPEEITASRRTIARAIGAILLTDPIVLEDQLQQRDLRYVPIMRKVPPSVSLRIKELQLASIKDVSAKRAQAATRKDAEAILDPLRGIALIPEHWRHYPDPTIASQVIGFLNTNQEAQYGIERTYDSMLRGHAGRISSLTDRDGGQILTSDQTIENPEDGDSVVLTIDPFIQKEVEADIAAAVESTKSDAGQVIVVDPNTGRILAMANAPLFNRNNYSGVYEKEPVLINPESEKDIAVEIYDPKTNLRVFNGFLPDVFSQDGRQKLSEGLRKTLDDLEVLYDLHDLARYFVYKGQTIRYEVFPSDMPGVWLRYRNGVGVGAYLNRVVQEIYEPGSVMKPITMAIAIDQGEVVPEDTYDDNGTVKKDEYEIDNNDHLHYGHVNMTNCLEFSINTCMTSVSDKLGNKLFHHALERFGFGRITGIELEDEITGELAPWRRWSNVQLATTAFGQGIAATPLQMVMALSALANGGKLMHPHIVDRVIKNDGTVEETQPQMIDQVLTKDSSDTITAMLVSSVEHGFAKKGQVYGYRVAGKTGTSQIAGPGGRYETGTGSTVASFFGYPVTNPRFLVLIKLDRPKVNAARHGATAAAPVFKQIATFLFKYYGIPPDYN